MKKYDYSNQWAIVTGASKGLGYCYAEQLLKLGFNVIGVARDTSPIQQLQEKYKNSQIKTINMDLSIVENNQKLFDETKDLNVTLLINNAGYGVHGLFTDTNLSKEMNMIDLNIKSLHFLTKLFINKFKENNYGRVLNIGSTASFTPAPVFSSYYASKAYVWTLGVAVNYELIKQKSNVRCITICPGPLKTDFWNRSSDQKDAKYSSKIKVMKTDVYANKSLNKALKTNKKHYIVTGVSNKFAKWLSTHIKQNIVLAQIYKYQLNR